MDEKPRVDKVSGEFFRKGRCERCGKQAERIRTFSAPTFDQVEAAGKAWGETPLLHKRCE